MMSQATVFMLAFITPVLANNETNGTDTTTTSCEVWCWDDPWAIAAVVMLSLLGVLVVTRLCLSVVQCEVQETGDEQFSETELAAASNRA